MRNSILIPIFCLCLLIISGCNTNSKVDTPQLTDPKALLKTDVLAKAFKEFVVSGYDLKKMKDYFTTHGVDYGKYEKQLSSFIETEVNNTVTRTLSMKKSLREIMIEAGITEDKESYKYAIFVEELMNEEVYSNDYVISKLKEKMLEIDNSNTISESDKQVLSSISLMLINNYSPIADIIEDAGNQIGGRTQGWRKFWRVVRSVVVVAVVVAVVAVLPVIAPAVITGGTFVWTSAMTGAALTGAGTGMGSAIKDFATGNVCYGAFQCRRFKQDCSSGDCI